MGQGVPSRAEQTSVAENVMLRPMGNPPYYLIGCNKRRTSIIDDNILKQTLADRHITNSLAFSESRCRS